MASIRVKGFTNFLLLLNPAAAAMEYGYSVEPAPTSFGLVGIQTMAPRPTRPPSMDEINGELRKRRLPDSIYSLIPKSWCGFVDGDFNTPISCSSKTCVVISDYLFTSLACSPYDDGKPTIYIRCLDSTKYASMPTLPFYDTTVCKYRSSPYCGKATLPRGEYYFFCDSTTLRSTVSLEYLEDWYITGITSITSTPTTTPTTTTSITDSPTHSSDRRLAAPAIAGIGVAIGAVVIGVIAGLGICLFLRGRKRKEGTNQPVAIPTEPSNPQMQQGNPGQNGRTGSTGLYPFSQNPSATPPPKNEMLPSLLPSVHKPGEVPRVSNSSDPAAQPTSPILGVGHHRGETGIENLIDNQAHEMGTGSASPNNRQGSGKSQNHAYHEISSGFAPPTRQSSGTQSPPPLHPIHEAPQAYYNENQAHGVLPSATSRPSGSGAYHEAAQPPREISAGVGGNHSYSNSISSNTGCPPQNDMDPPTPISPAVVTPILRINSGTSEGQQQGQYDIHEAPETMHYTAYSPEMSPITRSLS